jgi:hypothetical protein
MHWSKTSLMACGLLVVGACVHAGSGNAVWGVQVFWPIKAQYIVAYLTDDSAGPC